MRISSVAIFGVYTTIAAQPHNHYHHHHHIRNGSPIEARDATTSVFVETAVVTVYELNGQKISPSQVKSCLSEKKCVIVGTKVTASPENAAGQPIAIAPTSSVSTASERKTSLTASSSQALSPSPAPSLTPSPAAVSNIPAVPTTLQTSIESNSTNILTTINSKFPSGTIDCSEFPSAYGAVPADWVGLGGWTGVQKTPGYSLLAKAINYIETATAGEGCTPGSFCSYSCPAGYQKSQWPAAQGSSGQSIGGLYCNKNGKLELSRSSSSQICTPGVSNIQIKNLLGKNVAICRTDYPGTEAETVALNAKSGTTVKVACPDAKDYYRTWEGYPTSAQYYINPSGYEVEDACIWGSAGSNLGNWAPVNMGVGRAENGNTYVSLFPNVPTNPNGALDFNIDATGDINGHCAYYNGNFYKDGVISPGGCTVAVSGKAVFVFS